MEKKNFKIWKNRGFQKMKADIFEGTTSFTELKGGYNNMAKEEFTEEDRVKNEPLNLWKYKENSEISGKILRLQDGQYGAMVVLEASGQEVFVPSLTALNKLVNEENVGKRVKIVYLGEKKGKSGRLYGAFDIFLK